MTTEEFRAFCAMRNIETVCPECRGMGVKVYGTTATWHGGIGGATLTVDICDHCWGSGDATKPWLNLKQLSSFVEKYVGKDWYKLWLEHTGGSNG